MKYYETHFEEYVNTKINLHPKLEKIYKTFPKLLKNLKNIMFYGPPGVGKYTQMLKSIKKYSPSGLKYEKRISIMHNKQQYDIKISDIHFEIDMMLLGCNSRLLWHEIYQNIIDVVSAKTDKSGIIVCKCFHKIHTELLDNFYSYMQQNYITPVDLKFILIAEEISFIPDSIMNCCKLIHVPRPTKAAYQKCTGIPKLPLCLKLENIINIKMLYNYDENLMQPHKIICDKIIHNMLHLDELNFLKFRDTLYDIFIYDLDITDCIWYILCILIHSNHINNLNLTNILMRTYSFFNYYNNNYRPIYHVENYLLYITQIIHNHYSAAKPRV